MTIQDEEGFTRSLELHKYSLNWRCVN